MQKTRVIPGCHGAHGCHFPCHQTQVKGNMAQKWLLSGDLIRMLIRQFWSHHCSGMPFGSNAELAVKKTVILSCLSVNGCCTPCRQTQSHIQAQRTVIQKLFLLFKLVCLLMEQFWWLGFSGLSIGTPKSNLKTNHHLELTCGAWLPLSSSPDPISGKCLKMTSS